MSVRAFDEREMPSRHRKARRQVKAERRIEPRAAKKSREALREIDHKSRVRRLIFLVSFVLVLVLVLVPMLGIVPMEQRPEMVLVDVSRQKV